MMSRSMYYRAGIHYAVQENRCPVNTSLWSDTSCLLHSHKSDTNLKGGVAESDTDFKMLRHSDASY